MKWNLKESINILDKKLNFYFLKNKNKMTEEQKIKLSELKYKFDSVKNELIDLYKECIEYKTSLSSHEHDEEDDEKDYNDIEAEVRDTLELIQELQPIQKILRKCAEIMDEDICIHCIEGTHSCCHRCSCGGT